MPSESFSEMLGVLKEFVSFMNYAVSIGREEGGEEGREGGGGREGGRGAACQSTTRLIVMDVMS